jgi:hypothetical protein
VLTRELLTLPSRALQHRTRCFTKMKLRRALSTQPHQHSGRIDPIKGRNFARDSQRVTTLQTLQRLDEKHAVVSFALGAFIAMDAFSLIKELPVHGGRPFPSRRTARELR